MSMELIETVEVGSGGASSIEFTSIPQDGTDLVLKLSGRTGRTLVSDPVQIQPNSSTSNLSSIRLYGSGSAASSNSFSAIYVHAAGGVAATANTFGNGSVYISNYASSVAKSVSVDSVTEANQTAADQVIYAGLWDDATAITSLKLVPIVSFEQYSTASLYKITAA